MFPKNIDAKTKEIRHQDLEPGKNEFWKECPECDMGVVPLGRDLDTFVLNTTSRCFSCGQEYHFIDIVENEMLLKYKESEEIND